MAPFTASVFKGVRGGAVEILNTCCGDRDLEGQRDLASTYVASVSFKVTLQYHPYSPTYEAPRHSVSSSMRFAIVRGNDKKGVGLQAQVLDCEVVSLSLEFFAGSYKEVLGKS